MMPLSILYESELKSPEDNRALLTSVLSNINILLHSIFNRSHCCLTLSSLPEPCFYALYLFARLAWVPHHLQEEGVPRSLV